MKPKLFCSHLSPFVRKVWVALALKRIDYELVPVLPFDPPEGWRDISPLGKIPAWQDDHITVADSTVICEYLDEKVPEPPLYVGDAAERARCRWFEEYADTAMCEAMVYTLFAHRLVRPYITKAAVDESLIERAIDKLIPEVLNYLEASLRPSGYFVGDSFSMADLAVMSPLINMYHGGHEVAAEQWPRMAEFYQRMAALPEIAEVIAIEERIVASMRSPK